MVWPLGGSSAAARAGADSGSLLSLARRNMVSKGSGRASMLLVDGAHVQHWRCVEGVGVEQ